MNAPPFDPFRGVPGPWPWTLSVPPHAADYDVPGPLALVVLLPLLGGLVAPFVPARYAQLFARTSILWAIPGAVFLVAAAWFGGGGEPGAVRWLERLPGGAGLVLTPWNLVPALAVGLAAPLALLLPEPRTWEPARSGWLLVLAASAEAVLLAGGPELAAFGWLGSAWAVFFLLGHQDASGQGEQAVAPFVLHAFAAACVFVAGFVPGMGGLLVLAGAIRLGVVPFHGVHLRACELLPTGPLLLVGVVSVVTGLRAVHDGLLALGPGPGQELVAGLSAIAAVWGGLVALPQDDLRRRLGGFLAALAATWCGLLALLPPADGRAVVGGWALVVVVAYVALVVSWARLWAFTRTGDLRAYGGLARTALLRSTLLAFTLAAVLAAPLLAAGGRPLAAMLRLALVRPGAVAGLAIGGALGALGLGLAVYRTLRGAAPTPIEAPELRGREWAFVAGLALALAFLAALEPPLGGLGGLWPATP